MPTDTIPRAATAQEWREAFIIRQLEDRAARFYRVAGDGARYVIEGFVPDYTRAEWDFAEDYFRAHRAEILGRPDLTDDQIRDRNRQNARQASTDAHEAYEAGDYLLALYLIDLGEWWDANTLPWARIREAIQAEATSRG